VRSHPSARTWAAILHHNERVEELTALRAAVSSTVELVLGRSPNETSWVEVTNELVAKFQRWEELFLRLELTTRRLVDAKLGALQTSVAHVRDLVLGNADGSSSLTPSLSMAVELLEG
jgi:hypothetical protein